MSIELFVYLEKERLPSSDTWSKALSDAGFPFQIQAGSGLLAQSGFMVVMNASKRTGFEFSVDDAKDSLGQNDEVDELAGKLKNVACFRYSREDEHEVAMPSAVVLAMLSSGIFYDPQEDRVIHEKGELAEFLSGCHPDFWTNRKVDLIQVPLKQPDSSKVKMRDIMDRIGKLMNEASLLDYRLPESDVDRIIDRVPLVALAVLPLAVIDHMATKGISLAHPTLLGQAVVAVETISPKLTGSSLEHFLRLKQLCEDCLRELGFVVKRDG